MASATIKMDVKIGPTFRACLDVLELSQELLELIPEWHEQERQELFSRVNTLIELIQKGLKTKTCKPGS